MMPLVSPGPITAALHERLERLLREQAVVVWYDPARAFAELFDTLDLPGVAKLPYTGSWFALREAAEPHTRAMRHGTVPGARVLAYVPAARLAAAEDVLLPLAALGTTLELTLADAARAALGGTVPAETLREWLAMPGVTLATLEELASRGSDIGPLAVVFGEDGPQQVAFRLLAEPEPIKAVRKHKLERALGDLLGTVFGVSFGEAGQGGGEALRAGFARRVLLTEFLTDLEEVPEALRALAVPAPAQVEACRALAERLRRTRGMEEPYRTWAEEAEREWALAAPDYDPARIGRRDTLAFEERLALGHVATLARAGRWGEAAGWVAERGGSFWATVDAERKHQWDAARLAVALHVAADRALASVPARAQSPTWWVTRYVGEAGGEGGTGASAGAAAAPAALSEVDRLLRRLDVRAAGPMDEPGLDELVRLARARAADAERACAERFVESVRAAAGFEALPLQSDVFHGTVRPLLEAGKRTVLVLADALRFEMARDLEEALQGVGSATLGWALATPPTITKVGMAAFVPGAEGGITLAPAASGKGVEAVVGGVPLPGLTERLARYRAAYGARVGDLTLDDCLRVPQATLERHVRDADLLLLRAQDIDALGEGDNVTHARTFMTTLVGNVQRAVQRLARAGAQAFVVVADHGFLLRDDVDESMKRSVPAGEVLETHRRCVVGRHLERRDDLVVFRATELGVGGDLEIAVPCGVNVFRTPGNTAYFHGGLSLQELVVPVLRFLPAAPVGGAALKVSVEVRPAVLRTLVFQVVVRYGEGGQGELMGAARRLRLVVARGGGKQPNEVVGTTVGATQGFQEAGEAVHLEPGQDSTLLVQLTESVSGAGELTLHVTDVASGETLVTKKVKHDLAF